MWRRRRVPEDGEVGAHNEGEREGELRLTDVASSCPDVLTEHLDSCEVITCLMYR